MSSFALTVGLEVHVQLDVRTKLFSPAPFAFGGPPNTRVAPLDLGLPGTLPVLNRAALRLAIRAGLALEGDIAARTHFDRKHYFYPDLPKGYQITQFDAPFCRGGRVPLGDGRYGMLERVHLEEDAGKTNHTATSSLIDLNRAGAALIEIVGRPDLESADDAVRFLTELKQIMIHARVSSCDMEKGFLRCDANVSLGPADRSCLGTKVEIKNLNSFRMVHRAISFEAARQQQLLARGCVVERETRGFDDASGETVLQRRKEAADDYRYFADPDLPGLTLTRATVDEIAGELPELPDARRRRLIAAGRSAEEAQDLVGDPDLADLFDALVAGGASGEDASRFVRGALRSLLGEHRIGVAELGVPVPELNALLAASDTGKISRSAQPKVLEHLFANGGTASEAILRLELTQLQDEGELLALIDATLRERPEAVADYRAGRAQALHALIGQVMRRSRGQAPPGRARELLLRRLSSG